MRSIWQYCPRMISPISTASSTRQKDPNNSPGKEIKNLQTAKIVSNIRHKVVTTFKIMTPRAEISTMQTVPLIHVL